MADVLQHWLIDPAIGFGQFSVHHALRVLPVDACSDIGGAIGAWLGRYRFPNANARARETLARLRPELSPPDIEAGVENCWRNVGRAAAEYSVLGRIWSEGRIAVEGIEHYRQARAQGRPIVGLAMHLANWEILGLAAFKLGFPVSGIYQPPKNRFEHRIIVNARRRYGADLVTPGRRGAREALQILKNRSAAFGVYIDGAIDGDVEAPAFGRPLRLEGNLAVTARLATMTGAAVMPSFARRLEGARFKVIFQPPVSLARSGDRARDLAENVAQLNAVTEDIIRANLDQWPMLFDLRLPPVPAPP
jgi:KDO2-lipid IV(A) lauroyltransferase